MSNIISRGFLRYELPTFFIFIYWILLLLPFLCYENITLNGVQVIVGVAGAFGFSIAFGYLLYQVYDSFFHRCISKKMTSSRKLLSEWARTRTNLSNTCTIDDTRLVMLMDYTLYASPQENPLDSRIIDTIRGYWGQLQARYVSALAIGPALVLFSLSLWILSQFPGLVVDISQPDLGRLSVLLLDFGIIFSCILVLIWKTGHIIEEVDHLVSFVLRHNHKAVCRMLDTLDQEIIHGIAKAFRKGCENHSAHADRNV